MKINLIYVGERQLTAQYYISNNAFSSITPLVKYCKQFQCQENKKVAVYSQNGIIHHSENEEMIVT